jgi:hypothetical protein
MSRNRAKTTPSQDVMLEHLAYLVLCEHRPASWRDFEKFTINAKEYSFKRGTIRNNLSKLKRLGLIEFVYRSTDAYYSVPGENRCKRSSMTLNPARVYKRDLAAMIERMAFDAPAVHDIHLSFESHMIWQTLRVLASPSPTPPPLSVMNISTHAYTAVPNIFSSSTPVALHTRPISKDLVFPEMTLESGIKGRVTIHKSNTVSVILSCSESPIMFDIGGLVRLSSSLARIEERLVALIDSAQRQILIPPSASLHSSADNAIPPNSVLTVPQVSGNCYGDREKILLVPEYDSWIITMWHFGRDSIKRYAGEKFEVAWKDFHGEWIRVYSKEMNDTLGADNSKARKRCIVRIERQETPHDRLHDVVEHKLSLVGIAAAYSSGAA